MNEHVSMQVLKDFLGCWKDRNFSKMVKFTQITWRFEKGSKAAKQFLKDFYGYKKLISFEIKGSKIEGVFIDIEVEIKYKIRGNRENFDDRIFAKKIKARTICETEPYGPSEDGTWGVNPIGALREF